MWFVVWGHFVSVYVIDIHISADEYLKSYAGKAHVVNALCRSGQRLQFPASTLRPFVTHNGIKGSFEIEVDKNSKLIQVRRL